MGYVHTPGKAARAGVPNLGLPRHHAGVPVMLYNSAHDDASTAPHHRNVWAVQDVAASLRQDLEQLFVEYKVGGAICGRAGVILRLVAPPFDCPGQLQMDLPYGGMR